MPADLSAKYTTYDSNTGKPTRTGGKWPVGDGGPVPGPEPGIVLLKEVQDPRPVSGTDYDPSTHRVRRASAVAYDLQELEARTTWEIVALDADTVARNTRTAQRDAMKAQWMSQPPRLRGPFAPLFSAANALLDAGQDQDAIELVESAEPTSKVKGNQSYRAEFDAVKAGFLATLNSLTPEPVPEEDPIP